MSTDKVEPSAVEIPIELASSFAAASAPASAEAKSVVGVSDLVSPSPLLKRPRVLIGAAVAVVVVAILGIALGSRSPAGPARAHGVSSAERPAHPKPTPSAVVAPNPVASVTAALTAQAAPETSAPQARASAVAPVEAPEDDVKIAINIKPDGASLYYKGKVVGKTPFILKQPRGEKRSYEVGKSGYKTRRLSITGNEHSIGFELGMDTPHPEGL